MTAHTLQQQLRVTTLPDGRRAAVIDTVIPDDAPQEVREGLARRAIVNGGGTCPCGASWPQLNRAERRRLTRGGMALQVQVAHRAGCPAITSNLLAAVREWGHQ